MYKKILFAGIGLALLASPLLTSAQSANTTDTIASLQAQVNALVAEEKLMQQKASDSGVGDSGLVSAAMHALQIQIASLLAQMKALQEQGPDILPSSSSPAIPTASGRCVDLTNGFGSGNSDANTDGEVSKLQQFLAQDPSIYPEGSVTGNFGPATMKAVQRWQAAHDIVSSGTPLSTGYGYIGNKTRAAMSCGGVKPPLPPSPSENFSASPTTGSATHAWIFKAHVSPEASGESYAIDFGDGGDGLVLGTPGSELNGQFKYGATQFNYRATKVSLRSDKSRDFEFGHTYSKQGSYTAHLYRMKGQDRTELGAVTITVTDGSQNSVLSATPASGAVPLRVTFLGRALQKGNYTIDFGDDTSGAPLPAPNSCEGSTCTYGINHTYFYTGTYTAKLIQKGTCNVMAMAAACSSVAASALDHTLGSVTIKVGSTTPASNSTLSVIAPSSAVVNSRYTIKWSTQTGPRLSELAKSYPNATGQLIAYNNDGSLGVAQTIADNVPISRLLSGNISWLVGTSTNDGRALPAGMYTIKMVVLVPVSPVQQNAISQGNSSTFSIKVGPPLRDFSASPISGPSPLDVSFSNMVNSGFQVQEISIDFGDGQTAPAANCVAPTDGCISPGINVHTYASPGVYQAKLKSAAPYCTDLNCLLSPSDGTTTASVTITVTDTRLPPPPPPPPPRPATSTPTLGNTDEWLLSRGKLTASVSPGLHPGSGWQVAGVGDFNNDGTSDVLWYNSGTGSVDEWQLANGKWAASIDLGVHPGSGWQIAGVGDFNNDGTSDVLWFNLGSGQTDVWELSDGKWSASVSPGLHPGSGWQVAGVGDFNNDGTSDVLWYNSGTGSVDEWQLANGKWAASIDLGVHPGSGWQIAGVGDFNNDGTSDVLWFNLGSGQTDVWELSDGKWSASVSPGLHPGSGWQVAGVGDFNNDGTSDVLWYNSGTGSVDEWQLANGKWAASIDLGVHPGSGWQIAGVGDFNGDKVKDVFWYNPKSSQLLSFSASANLANALSALNSLEAALQMLLMKLGQ